MKTVSHWIGGKPVAGTSTRTGPVYNPATGEQQAEVLLASAADVDAAVQAAAGGVRDVVAVVAGEAHQGPVRVPRAGQRAHRRARRAHHRRARQGALRRARRGAARPGGRRVRLRHPHLLKGEFSDQVSTGVDVFSFRQPLGVVRRHHAVQLPGHGADVDVPGRDRVRQHLRAQAQRAGPVARRSASPSCGPRPGCPTACSTSCTATRWPSTRCSITRTSPRSPSSAPPRSPSTSTRRGLAHGKRVQALGGAKNHAIVLPDADIDFAADHLVAAAFGSAGERCMAISAAVAVGGAADELVAAVAGEGPRGQGRPRPRPRVRDGPGHHRRGPRPDRRPHRHRRRAGRRARRRRPRPHRDGPRGRLLRRPHRDRPASPPTWTSTARRSSARCCRWCASTPSTRPSS